MLLHSVIFQSVSHAGGILEFKERVWDLGKLKSYDIQTHSFKFRNAGDSDIEIVEVVTSCGCTAAVAGEKVIKKGKGGEISVTFDPSGKSGDYSTEIKVFTKGAKAPYPLVIKAELSLAEKFVHKVKIPVPVISVNPSVVDLGRVKFGETAYYKVVVGNSGDGDLFIKNFNAVNESSGMPLSKKPIGKDKRIELTGYYVADVKGRIDDFLSIKSNDPESPIFRVRITGIVE